MMMRFEPQEYVIGPAYCSDIPIWRYRKALRAEDGEVRHLLEMPGVPGNEVVVKDDEVESIGGRRFFAWQNRVYHSRDEYVTPRYFCSVGNDPHSEECIVVARRIAEFLDAGGSAWSREFDAISMQTQR